MVQKAKVDQDETQPDKPTDETPTPKSNGEKRLFQLQDGRKVELTRAEATKKGFYWKP